MQRPRRILLVNHGDAPAYFAIEALEAEIARRPGWMVRLQRLWPTDPTILARVLEWKPDGILSFCGAAPADSPLADLPLVGLRNGPAPWLVGLDHRAIGALAVDHLLENGHTTIACVLPEDHPPTMVRERHLGVANRLAEKGLPLHYLHPPSSQESQDATAAFVEALMAFPQRPCAIIAWNDYFAECLFDACEQLGLRVPEDVALIGVDGLASAARKRVPLSSIVPPHDQLGLVGLTWLERLWAGQQPPQAALLLPPVRVIARRSTAALPSNDLVVVGAMQFIDAHAPAPLGVDQIAAACHVSRRSLEVRFRQATGRTVKEHLDRIRAGIAQDLLATSRLSISQIAERLGFTDATNLARMLRRVTGRSPREFRKKS